MQVQLHASVNQYIATLATVGKSAVSTVEMGWAIATSDRNIRRYRAAVWIIKELAVIAWMVCKASWQTIVEWTDGEVSRCLEQPTLDREEVVATADPVEVSSAVHIPATRKFPVFQRGSVHAVEPTIAGLLPAAKRRLDEMERWELLAIAEMRQISGCRKMSNQRLVKTLSKLQSA